jgi:MerR family transcriptional regulator, copper efflux regulator
MVEGLALLSIVGPWLMRIGELATRAGVKAQTLRYYERRGLLDPARRATSGFREYEANALRQVRFIRRAQDLGFTLEEIRDLLGLWGDSSKSCSAVEKRASVTLDRIEEKIADLRQMSEALSKYVSACRNSAALQQCPLLAQLGEMEHAADS